MGWPVGFAPARGSLNRPELHPSTESVGANPERVKDPGWTGSITVNRQWLAACADCHGVASAETAVLTPRSLACVRPPASPTDRVPASIRVVR
jgi:hypothetical protein